MTRGIVLPNTSFIDIRGFVVVALYTQRVDIAPQTTLFIVSLM